MDFRFIKTAILAMGLALASNANANIYDFSETFNSVSVTGSFNGTANGNDITGITNISVTSSGIAFIGPLNAFGLTSGVWTLGAAVVTFDGYGNNFMFANNSYSTYYSDTNPGGYTNMLEGGNVTEGFNFNSIYIYGGGPYNGLINLGYSSSDGTPQNWSVTPAAVPVPAAVWLFGSALAGFIVFNRRKPARPDLF